MNAKVIFFLEYNKNKSKNISWFRSTETKKQFAETLFYFYGILEQKECQKKESAESLKDATDSLI